MKKSSLIVAVVCAFMLTALSGCSDKNANTSGESNLSAVSSFLSESSAEPSSKKPSGESSAAPTLKPQSESKQESISETHSESSAVSVSEPGGETEDSETTHVSEESREPEDGGADSSYMSDEGSPPAYEANNEELPKEMTDEYPDITGMIVELETDDHNKVLEAFTEKYKEAAMAIPESSRYAISDFRLRELVISTESLKDGADFAGYIRYAVKPLYAEYVLAGGAEYGTGEYEGYILDYTGYYIHSEDGKQWKAVERAY